MKYRVVNLMQVAELIAKNLETHYEDVKIKDEHGKPKPDWDKYFELDRQGGCKVIIAEDDNKVVAYSVFIIDYNINQSDVLTAINTSIFIDKEYRGKITRDFITKSTFFLKEMGIKEIMFSTSDRRIGCLLKRLGYKSRYETLSLI